MYSKVIGLLTLAVFFLFSACTVYSPDAYPPDATAAEAKPETSISLSKPAAATPLGQLGTNVIPTHYQIELTLLPEADSFSGKVDIDVSISKATDRIFLHGQGLKVDKVTLQQDSLALSAD